jgi:hypothetical protein
MVLTPHEFPGHAGRRIGEPGAGSQGNRTAVRAKWANGYWRLCADVGVRAAAVFRPQAWRQVFARALSDGQIRFVGLISMLAGLLLLAVWT